MNISSNIQEKIFNLRKELNIDEIYKEYYLTFENNTKRHYLSEKKIKDITLKFLLQNCDDIEEYDFLDFEEQNNYKKRKYLIDKITKEIDSSANKYVYALWLNDNTVFVSYSCNWKYDITEKFFIKKFNVKSLICMIPNGDLILENSLYIYFGKELGFDKVSGEIFTDKKFIDWDVDQRIKYVKELNEKKELVRTILPEFTKIYKKKKKGRPLTGLKIEKVLNYNTDEPPSALNGNTAIYN